MTCHGSTLLSSTTTVRTATVTVDSLGFASVQVDGDVEDRETREEREAMGLAYVRPFFFYSFFFSSSRSSVSVSMDRLLLLLIGLGSERSGVVSLGVFSFLWENNDN